MKEKKYNFWFMGALFKFPIQDRKAVDAAKIKFHQSFHDFGNMNVEIIGILATQIDQFADKSKVEEKFLRISNMTAIIKGSKELRLTLFLRIVLIEFKPNITILDRLGYLAESEDKITVSRTIGNLQLMINHQIHDRSGFEEEINRLIMSKNKIVLIIYFIESPFYRDSYTFNNFVRPRLGGLKFKLGYFNYRKINRFYKNDLPANLAG